MSSGWAAREGFDGHEPPVPGDAGPLQDPARGPGGVAPDEGMDVLHGLTCKNLTFGDKMLRWNPVWTTELLPVSPRL